MRYVVGFSSIDNGNAVLNTHYHVLVFSMRDVLKNTFVDKQ